MSSRCEALPSTGYACVLGCSARYQTFEGKWLWLCERHLNIYRRLGLVSWPEDEDQHPTLDLGPKKTA